MADNTFMTDEEAFGAPQETFMSDEEAFGAAPAPEIKLRQPNTEADSLKYNKQLKLGDKIYWKNKLHGDITDEEGNPVVDPAVLDAFGMKKPTKMGQALYDAKTEDKGLSAWDTAQSLGTGIVDRAANLLTGFLASQYSTGSRPSAEEFAKVAPWLKLKPEQVQALQSEMDKTDAQIKGASSNVIAGQNELKASIGYKSIYDPVRHLKAPFMQGNYGEALKNIPGFAAEQFVTSLPNMLAAMLAPQMALPGETGRIAMERAGNDKRGYVSDKDMTIAAPVGAAITVGERIGLGKILEPGPGLRGVVGAGLTEGGTEFVQEAAEDVASTVDTEKGWNPLQSFEMGVYGALGGAPAGSVAAIPGALMSAPGKSNLPPSAQPSPTGAPSPAPPAGPAGPSGGPPAVGQSRRAPANPIMTDRDAFGSKAPDAPPGMDVNTQPSEAQKAAGNYKKGHTKVQGLDISIENPKGTDRTSKDPANPWSVTMPVAYGYVKRTKGADGDQVDVFIADKADTSDKVFVIDQVDPETGNFDEHKAILGVDTAEEAARIYHDSYSDGKGVDRLANMVELSMDEFKTWARRGDTSKPLWGNRMLPPAKLDLEAIRNPAPAAQAAAPMASAPKAAVPEPGKAKLAPRASNAQEMPAAGQSPMAPRQPKIGTEKPSDAVSVPNSAIVPRKPTSDGETQQNASVPNSRKPIARRDVADDEAITSSGRKVPVKYAIVEAADLILSQNDDGSPNPAYPAELQPRDRERRVSATQVHDIATKLEPRLLDKSAKASDGAPIMSEDGVMESGNGRGLAIRRAYARSMPGGERYRAYLKEQGYPVDGVKEPVLVRVRQGKLAETDRQSFTREANERDTLELSSPERAMSDSAALSEATLALYRGGEIDEAGNRDFVKAFMSEAVNKNDRGKMMDENGAISQDAVRRIGNALLAKAYGDVDLIAKLTESTEVSIKGIGGALLDVAGTWAQMRAEAAEGRISKEVDQTKALLEAVRMVDRSRKENRPLALLVGQNDIFSGKGIAVETEFFLSLMYRDTENWKQPVSRKSISEALTFFVGEARKTFEGTDLLGETAARAKDILATAKRKQADGYDTSEADQGSLALSKPRDGGRDGEDAGEARQGREAPSPPRQEAESSAAVEGDGPEDLSPDGAGILTNADMEEIEALVGGDQVVEPNKVIDDQSGDVTEKGAGLPTVKQDLQVAAPEWWTDLTEAGRAPLIAKVSSTLSPKVTWNNLSSDNRKKVEAAYQIQQKAMADAPTWAEVMSALPKDANGEADLELAGRLMFEISGVRQPSFRDLTPEQKVELLEQAKAAAKPLPQVPPNPPPGSSEPTPVKDESTPSKNPSDGRIEAPESSVPPDQAKIEAEKPAIKNAGYGTKNTLVSADRAAELREKLRNKLRDQLNAGIDPEMLAIGAELAAFHIEAGARKFGDFARAMASDLGASLVKIRPYLRSWYNGARDMMEDNGLDVTGMEDAEQVKEELRKLFEPQAAATETPKPAPAAPQEELPALISTSLQTGKTKKVDLKKPAPTTADLFGDAAPTAPAEAARNWQAEGDAAFKAGKNRIVPIEVWTGVTSKEGNKRADAWYKGWDRANLAAPVPETSALPGDFRPGEDVEITQTAQGLRVGDSVDVPSRTIGRSVIEALWSRNTMGNRATDFARLRNAEGKKLIVIGSEMRNNKTDPFTPTNTETDRDTFLYAIKRNERVKTKAGIFSIRDRGNLGWTVIEHNDGYNVEKGPGTMEKWGKDFAAERAAEEAGLTPGTQQAQIATAPKEGTDNGPAAGTGLREGSPTVSGAEQPGSAGEATGPASVPQPGGPGRGADAPAAIGPDAVGDQQPVQGPARSDAGQTAGTGSNSSDGGRNDNGPTDPAAIAKNVEAEREIAQPPNYQITDADHVGEGGPKAKVAANLEALRLLKVLEAENRKATPSEQAVLVRYVGWGAFAQDMFQDAKPEWAKERAELKSLITTEEYDSARASVLNAHYTSPEVIKGMWGAMEYLGFTGGRAIEPASGVGHFIGMTPAALRDKVKWTATELDKVTGAIAQQLYQRADVNVQGFETLNRPNGFYDVAISNVPFGSFNIRDLRYKDEYLIHDYFFIRSLDLVRPGGVVAFITSSGTMDKANDSARAEIMKRADLLGAIRLPGGRKGAFAGNAGTEVTTDILFLRRKGPGLATIANEWQNLKEIQTPDGPTRINEYFAARPEMMLGQMRLVGSMYRDKSPVLEGDAANIEGKILDAARQMPANSYLQTEGAPPSEAKAIDKETSGRTKEGAFYLEGDKVMRKVLGLGTEPGLSAVDQDKVRRLVQMRDTVSQLLNVSRDRSKDALARQRLNSQYDAFVKKYGAINRETVTVTSRLNKAGENIIIRRLPNMAAFRADPDAYKVAAIENYDAEKDTATKAALFSGEVVSDSPAAELKNAIDGIGWSLNAFGELNMTAIGDRLGKSKQQIIDELGERVFLNPNGDRWEPAEQYLAGDVVAKLDDARAAAEADRAYQRNVAALEAVQPEQLNQEDITVPFGAAWVPGSVYEQFLEEVIGTTGKAKVALNPVTKQYSLAGVNFSISAQTQFGTNKVGVAEIISHAFQMKSPRVTETVRTPDGGTKEVVNEEATREAQVKTQLVRKIFEGDIQEGAEGWVWQDADRGELLAKLYNRKFNRLVQQKFDGSHLTFPGLATVITDGSGNVIPFALREHQKASVWRAVQNGNTLLDHVVGAGKTFTMIAAAMEMKRLGQIQRPMFIVPNHMLEQFSREFLQAYPNANILVAQKDEMTRSNRKAFAAKIAAERWDGIVITHDAFGRLPLSKEVYVKFMKDEIAEIEAAIRHMKAMQNKKDPTVKQLESMKKRAAKRMKKLIATERKDEGVLFEELGVDQLILDEAHLFKNLQFYTQHTRVKGLAQGASQRAMDMFLKVRELEKTRPGRSAIFATGTPISNTMAEMYTMQRYLQLDELVKLGIDRFDAWAATFGEIRTNMELSPDGRTFRETSSFSRFRNLPELVALYSKMADTKTADMLNLPRPKLKGGKPIIVEAEPSIREEDYIQGLVKRAEQVRGKKAEKGGDNMLKVVSEGRKVALDFRLIDPDHQNQNTEGKVARMVDNVTRIWRDGNNDPVAKAQIVFCDMGVPFTEKAAPEPRPETDVDPDEVLDDDENADAEEVDADESEALRSRYNLYEEMRRQLVRQGIPKQQIAFIHEAKDDSKKAALFEKVRRGEVRILFGSTGKMGVGTNVQKRLKAMHHLDAPWKPAEVEQRDGRILRQGNMNPEIEIYRYITKRSFDSFMWQTLERKANFIAQIKAGARGVRIAEDIDSPLPEAAELKAAASGDPRIMQHAELTKEVRDLEARFSSHVRTIGQARRDLAVRQDELEKLEKQLPQVAADAAQVPVTAGDNFKVELLVGKKGEYTKRAEAGAAVVAFLAEQAALPTKGVFKLTVARFNGLEIVAALNNRFEIPGVTLAVKGYMGRGLEFGLAEDRTPQLDAALMSRMESELADLGVVKGNMEYRIAQIQKELPKIQVAAEDRPFPRMDRMKQAKQELSDLTKALGEDKNKKPAGPVVMGNVADGVDAQPPFYSALLRTVTGLKMTKAPASQWLSTIKNQQGVKAEELAWLGVEDWLNGQPGAVTKDALAEFIRANQVQVQEVVKGGEDTTSLMRRLVTDRFGRGVRLQDLSAIEQAQMQREWEAQISTKAGGPTKFSSYQLPGGENYREMLLTLPETRLGYVETKLPELAMFEASMAEKYGGPDVYSVASKMTPDEMDRYAQLTTSDTKYRQNAALDRDRNANYRSSHWEESNVLAHVRFNERTADGKRTLFIEEIQSDWHQKGRKQGYRKTAEEIARLRIAAEQVVDGKLSKFMRFVRRQILDTERNTIDIEQITNSDVRHWVENNVITSNEGSTLSAFIDAYEGGGSAVPDAPFKTTWPELALKRMVRWAAENGFDQVAWTPGEVQADRYNLAKVLDGVNWTTRPGIGKRVTAAVKKAGFGSLSTNMDGKIVLATGSLESFMDKNLDEVFGKDLAEKIMTDEKGELEGEGLRIGGTGMKAFYDKMLVDAANKLGKKFGAKVKVGDQMPGRDYAVVKENAGRAYGEGSEAYKQALKNQTITTHTLPITPDMRRAAMQGVPLFEAGKFPPTQFVASRKQINAAAAEVERLTQKMLGRKVKTFTNDIMPSFIPPEFIAAYGEHNRTIYITMRAAHDLANNVGHESLHAMRQLGLIDGQEWTALVAMAKKHGFKPTPQSLELYRREYVGRFGMTEAQFTDKIDEESVARLFGNYVSVREKLTPWTRKVIDALLRWADAVLVAIGAAGVQVKARDVMAKAYRGDLAGREEGRGQLALDQLAVAGAAQDVTQTPEFKAWFEDSKVVDNYGNPLVVYHGTNSDITVFSKKKLGSATKARSAKLGFFFADDADVAGSYANRNNPYDLMAEGENGLFLQKLMEWSGGRYEKVNEAILGIFGKSAIPKGQNVLPVFLKIKNPAYMELNGEDFTDQPLTAFMEKAIAAGHDGVIIREVVDPGPSPANGWAFMPSTHYVVFEPTQIKSVFNGGKFDPSNPMILGNAGDGRVWWHGSMSGDLRGGVSGLHLGTKEAATQALNARIGIPAAGEWDGTREYGSTLLAGKKTLKRLDPRGYNVTGYNVDAPEEDYYPTRELRYPDGTIAPMTNKPSIRSFKIKGPMTNSWYRPHEDFKANGYMKASLKKGTARSGFYYKNVGEDAGSISIVVPNGSHLEPVTPSILGNTPDGSGSGGGSVPPAAVAVDAAAQDELAKYAASINLHRINTSDDIKRLIAHVADEAGNFIGERRGKISHEQTVAMAEELGLTEKQLLSRKSGDAWNNAYIFAARTLLIKSGERVLKLAERAGTSNSTTDLAEALRAVQRHLAIQEQVSGLATEAGRALDQFNIMAAKDFGTALDQILRGARTNKSTLAAKMGGEEALAHELVSMIAQLKDPSKVSEFIGKAYKATFWDMVREFWVSSLLSGPKTIIVNLIGNVGVALWQVPTTAVAASISTMRGGPNRVRMAEINARMSGLVAGSWEGMRLAGQYFMTGESSAPITKLDNHKREAIPGALGYLVRTPLRAMEAGDQFFKEVNRRAELHALAVRMALEEQRTGAAYDARVAELVDKPSIAMQRQMRDAALYGTFQRDLGPVGRMVMNLREVIPGAWLIIPFIKTGVNLGKFAVEHSPLALASLTLPNSLKSVVAANLRGDNGRVAQDTQIAKIAMGTGMIIGVVSMVAAGVLTGGGPDDWEEKQVWLAAGNQPYSIKIGGTWYSYQRFDPFALLIGVTADFVEASEGMASKQIDEIAAILIHSIANVTTEKSWFKGPADFFDAFFSKTSSQKSMERYVQGIVSSILVPSLVNQVGQYVDPVWRETNSMAEKIRSRLPYKSQSLMPRRNIFGEELRGEGSFGPDLLSPVWTTTVKDNKLANELLELQYFPSLPNRIVNGHKLTPEQFDRYVELSGKQAVKTLEKRMTGEAWRNFDPDKRIEKIRDAFNDARDDARKVLKREWPELRHKAEDN